MNAALGDVAGVQLPIVPAGRTHAFYQYCAYVPDRDAVVHGCLKHGVDLETLHVDVCATLPLFAPFAAEAPGAETTEQAIQIPVYESLTPAEVERVAGVVRQMAERAAVRAVAAPANAAKG
jgi:dTDP-4-amino-4,6-dideoxygalactose transaminase